MLARVQDAPLSVDECLAAVAGPDRGGTGLFVGTVRDHDGGKEVAALRYEAHPRAEEALRDVVARAAAREGVAAAAAVHRVGDLAVGDLAVVVAVSGAHRAAALEATRWLIDELKATVPVWKHQRFADGTEEWVGAP